MEDQLSIAEQIEAIYDAEIQGPFPYSDCSSLAKYLGVSAVDLISEFDLYLSDIAGFSSSATTLFDRPVEELSDARRILNIGFFQRFPERQPIQSRINAMETPVLFRELQAADKLRRMLLQLLDDNHGSEE